MICSKRILTIFFIFVLAASNSVLLGQVVIKEKVTIEPTSKSARNLESEIEYNPLNLVLLGGRAYTYSLSGPVSSISGTDTGDNVIIDSMAAVNGQYTITISSSCECTTSVGWSVTWKDQYGNNQWVAGFEMWFHEPGTKSETFTFTGIPSTEPCDFDFTFDENEICDTSQYVSIQRYLLSSQDCVPFPDITISIQPGLTDLVIFNEENMQSCGTSVTINSTDLDHYKLKLNSGYYGTEPEEVSISMSTGDITRTNIIEVMPTTENYTLNVYLEGSKMISSGGYTYFYLEIMGNDYCPYVIPADINFNAEIIYGSQYGYLYFYDTGAEGTELFNIAPYPGENYIYLDYYANNITPDLLDSIIIRFSTSDSLITPVEKVLYITPFPLKITAEPNPVLIGDSSKIIPQYFSENIEYESFPEDWEFDIELFIGTEYGTLYSDFADGYSNSFWSTPGNFYFVPNDNIEEDSIVVTIMMGTLIETDGGGGISGSILSTVNDSINSKLKQDETLGSGIIKEKSSLIKESIKKDITENLQKNRKKRLSKHKNVIEINSTKNMNDIDVIPVNSSVEGLYYYYTSVDIIVQKSNDCSDAPQCEQDLIIPEIQVHPIYTNEYKGKDLCTVGVNPGGGFLPAYDNAFTYQPDPYSIVTPLKNEYYLPYEIEVCFNTNINDGDGGWQYQLYTPGISEVALGIRAFIILNCNVGDYSFPNINALNEVDPPDICMILKEFEKQRMYPIISYSGNYDIEEIVKIHEECHFKQYRKFVEENFCAPVKFNFYGLDISGGFCELFEFYPYCSDTYSTVEEVIYRGNIYFNKLLNSFMKFARNKFKKRKETVLGEKYDYIELEAHWSDSVQNRIDDYQNRLVEIAKNSSIKLNSCDYIDEYLRNIFKKYRNNL